MKIKIEVPLTLDVFLCCDKSLHLWQACFAVFSCNSYSKCVLKGINLPEFLCPVAVPVRGMGLPWVMSQTALQFKFSLKLQCKKGCIAVISGWIDGSH